MNNPNQPPRKTYEELAAEKTWDEFWSEDRPAEYDYYAYDRPQVLGRTALQPSMTV